MRLKQGYEKFTWSNTFQFELYFELMLAR